MPDMELDFTTAKLRPLMFSEDWGKEVERRMIETMDQLHEFALNGELSEEGELLVEPETPSGNAFCGCGDCVVRETLYLAMQLALEGHQQGLIELVDAEDVWDS
jgi:hypothetical protein